MTLYAKLVMPDSQKYPESLNRINNMKIMLFFLCFKALILIVPNPTYFPTEVTVVVKPQFKLIRIQGIDS